MLWAQRIHLSVHSICAPTAVCGRLRVARSLPPRSSFCFASYKSACTPVTQKGLLCGNVSANRHSAGQMSMRANAKQNAGAVGQDSSPTDAEKPALAPYRVVNFYHLVDIHNPFQVSYLVSAHSAYVMSLFCSRPEQMLPQLHITAKATTTRVCRQLLSTSYGWKART